VSMDDIQIPSLETLAEGALNAYREAFDDPFDAAEAAVFRIDRIGSANLYRLEEFVRAPDVYQAMWAASHGSMPDETVAIGVTSCGWAAPTDDGVAPSEHPNRRRVMMVVIGDRSMEMCSGVLFQGDADPTLNLGEGEGLLKERFKDMIISMLVATAVQRN
jgi:hypothetical protein